MAPEGVSVVTPIMDAQTRRAAVEAGQKLGGRVVAGTREHLEEEEAEGRDEGPYDDVLRTLCALLGSERGPPRARVRSRVPPGFTAAGASPPLQSEPRPSGSERRAPSARWWGYLPPPPAKTPGLFRYGIARARSARTL